MHPSIDRKKETPPFFISPLMAPAGHHRAHVAPAPGAARIDNRSVRIRSVKPCFSGADIELQSPKPKQSTRCSRPRRRRIARRRASISRGSKASEDNRRRRFPNQQPDPWHRPGRQHQNGSLRARPDLSADLQSVHVRQHEIENQRIECLARFQCNAAMPSEDTVTEKPASPR